jgi:alpha-methylacyl-CoA racemase
MGTTPVNGACGERSGPLSGVSVVEVGGIGPVPLFGMLLADLGASVIRVDRPGAPLGLAADNATFRDRRSIEVDLGQPAGVDLVLRMVERADVLAEGWRPGVAERIGIAPADCMARNPRLVYARMTGWGGYGPLSDKGGHDINYVALTGALHSIGPADGPPAIPLNLIGDYGGGTMMLVMGVLAALVERASSSKGQVVEAAMVDGTLALMSNWYSARQNGRWTDERCGNMISGAAPFYNVYETSDGRYLAVGAIEPKFYADLVRGLGLSESLLPAQRDESTWSEVKQLFAETFLKHSSSEWETTFAGLDACVTPVLNLGEAPAHPHNAAREAFVEVDGKSYVAPPVRFSRTPARIHATPPERGRHVDEILGELGFDAEGIEELERLEVLGSRRG